MNKGNLLDLMNFFLKFMVLEKIIWIWDSFDII